MWGIEREDKKITVYRIRKSEKIFQLTAPLFSLMPRRKASTCKFGAAESGQGKAGEGGSGPQGNEDLWP